MSNVTWEGDSDMMETAKSGPRMRSVLAAAGLTVGLTPMVVAPQINSGALVEVSIAVALTSGAVADGLDGFAGATAFDVPGAADAFDLGGLLNAEFAAAQGFVNSLFSLPGTLFNDFENLFTSLVDLNFGEAFSALFSIPQDIVNYVLGLPGLVINTVYEMAVVIPGEFLFNFG